MSVAYQTGFDLADEDLKQRVFRLLFSRNFPVFRELEIEVRNGSVTLTGNVHSYYQKQVVLTSCQSLEGVVSLIDQIDVYDRDLEESERELIEWSAKHPK